MTDWPVCKSQLPTWPSLTPSQWGAGHVVTGSQGWKPKLLPQPLLPGGDGNTVFYMELGWSRAVAV